MRISDWSLDVCSSDQKGRNGEQRRHRREARKRKVPPFRRARPPATKGGADDRGADQRAGPFRRAGETGEQPGEQIVASAAVLGDRPCRSEEHTSELQSLMRISYAVFCLKKTN